MDRNTPFLLCDLSRLRAKPHGAYDRKISHISLSEESEGVGTPRTLEHPTIAEPRIVDQEISDDSFEYERHPNGKTVNPDISVQRKRKAPAGQGLPVGEVAYICEEEKPRWDIGENTMETAASKLPPSERQNVAPVFKAMCFPEIYFECHEHNVLSDLEDYDAQVAPESPLESIFSTKELDLNLSPNQVSGEWESIEKPEEPIDDHFDEAPSDRCERHSADALVPHCMGCDHRHGNTSRSTTVSVPELYLDDGILGSGIKTPESGYSLDDFDDTESIFSLDSAPIELEWDLDGLTTQRFRISYANSAFWLAYGRICGLFRSCPASEARSGSNSPAARSRGLSTSSTKRKADQISSGGGTDGMDNGEDHEDDGGNPGSQSKLRSPRALGPSSRHLACPFFKRYGNECMSCGFSDYENASRVKFHITRRHKLPIYCPRCSETFQSENKRDDHLRAANCSLLPQRKWVGATAEQLRQLNRRSTAPTERERWNAVYAILFPDDPLPDSPYLDAAVASDIHVVRKAFLAAAPSAASAAIKAHIREELGDIPGDTLQRIISRTNAEVFDQLLNTMQLSTISPGARGTLETTVFETDYLDTVGGMHGESPWIEPDENPAASPEATQPSGMTDQIIPNDEFVQALALCPMSPRFEAELRFLTDVEPVDWSFNLGSECSQRLGKGGESGTVYDLEQFEFLSK